MTVIAPQALRKPAGHWLHMSGRRGAVGPMIAGAGLALAAAVSIWMQPESRETTATVAPPVLPVSAYQGAPAAAAAHRPDQWIGVAPLSPEEAASPAPTF